MLTARVDIWRWCVHSNKIVRQWHSLVLRPSITPGDECRLNSMASKARSNSDGMFRVLLILTSPISNFQARQKDQLRRPAWIEATARLKEETHAEVSGIPRDEDQSRLSHHPHILFNRAICSFHCFSVVNV